MLGVAVVNGLYCAIEEEVKEHALDLLTPAVSCYSLRKTTLDLVKSFLAFQLFQDQTKSMRIGSNIPG